MCAEHLAVTTMPDDTDGCSIGWLMMTHTPMGAWLMVMTHTHMGAWLMVMTHTHMGAWLMALTYVPMSASAAG